MNESAGIIQQVPFHLQDEEHNPHNHVCTKQLMSGDYEIQMWSW